MKANELLTAEIVSRETYSKAGTRTPHSPPQGRVLVTVTTATGAHIELVPVCHDTPTAFGEIALRYFAFRNRGGSW